MSQDLTVLYDLHEKWKFVVCITLGQSPTYFPKKIEILDYVNFEKNVNFENVNFVKCMSFCVRC